MRSLSFDLMICKDFFRYSPIRNCKTFLESVNNKHSHYIKTIFKTSTNAPPNHSSKLLIRLTAKLQSIICLRKMTAFRNFKVRDCSVVQKVWAALKWS